MDKVKLPREVAEAIQRVRSHYKSGCEYDLDLLKKEDWDCIHPIVVFTQDSRVNMQLYFEALVNGYEVEQTPEDKVRDYFNYCKNSAAPEIRSEMYGIRNTLNILGIKIEGVNI